MSWSLGLRNGDLYYEGAHLAPITGSNKLMQDFMIEILTKMGDDPFHPQFGSIIQGGILQDGTPALSLIGETDWNQVQLTISSEIQRIARGIQQQQLARIQSDRSVYGKSTITDDELLGGISNLEMTQIGDTLLVTVVLATGTGNQQQITIPITNAPLSTSVTNQ